MDEPQDRPFTGPDETPKPASPAARSQSYAQERVSDGSQPAAARALRASWNLLLYAAMATTLYLFFLGPVLYWAGGYLGKLWLTLLAEVGLVVVAWAPAVVMATIEGVPFNSYGLPVGIPSNRSFWLGTIWGLASITALVFIMRGIGVLWLGHLILHGKRVWEFAVYWAALFFCVGLFEEFLTRGYAQRKLTQIMGYWPAAVLLSAGFVGMHVNNPGETFLGLLAVGYIGLFFCLTLWRTGTLWFAVGFHATWDWGQSFLYSVPDSGTVAQGRLLSSSLHGASWLSGGTVGPEGSVLVFVVIGAVWMLFLLSFPTVKYRTD